MARTLLFSKLLTFAALGAAFVPMVGLVGQAEALSPCGLAGTMTSALESKYSEVRAATGIVGDKHVMELWTSKTGSWTVLIINTQGVACMVASGESLSVHPPKQSTAGTH